MDSCPVLCADSDGIVRYVNPGADALTAGNWKDRPLEECLPEFFKGQPDEMRLEYRELSGTQSLRISGKKLEITRLGDSFFCRIQSFKPEEKLPENELNEHFFRIRDAIEELFSVNSREEDELYDLMDAAERRIDGKPIPMTARSYQPFLDLLHQSSISGRAALLGCNRLEISMGDFSQYPPQRIELVTALETLREDMKEAVPQLLAPVSWELPKGNGTIAFNQKVFGWMILEAIRTAEISSCILGGTVILTIRLKLESDKAVLTFLENCMVLPDGEKPKPQPERVSSFRLIERCASSYGASASSEHLGAGDYRTVISFPLLKEEEKKPGIHSGAPHSTLELHTSPSRRYPHEILGNDILVYLEAFSK